MKLKNLITSVFLSAALLTGAAGCSKEPEYYNPNTLVTTEASSEVSSGTPKTTTEAPTTTEEETTEPETTVEETTTEAAAQELTVGSTWYVNTDQLNIRQEPSVYAEIVGELYRSEEVLILALTEDGWARITSATADGFVKTDFLISSSRTARSSGSDKEAPDPSEPETPSAAASETPDAAQANAPAGNGHIVCIDAGHQQAGISEQEPNGPGSSVMKAKLTTGTSGVATGQTEYQFNLDVSQMLKAELIDRGYSVVMIRETNDCPLSNAERAQVANQSGAEIFVRIHANSVDDQSVSGAMFYAPSTSNPYLSADVVNGSISLSQTMLDTYCAVTGLTNKGILYDDTMTGINWCTIPVTIAELGFMSNPDEDRKLADPAFQAVMAQGLADGIDAYFGR